MSQRVFLAFLFAALFLTGCQGSAGNTSSGDTTPAGVAVNVSPGSPSIRAGGSQLFTAAVTGTSNTAVTWSVVGGSANGAIDATGNYTAPGTLPSTNLITVQAVSEADPTKQGSSAVTLLNPVPIITAVTPNTIGVGAYTLVITGSEFVNGATVMFGGTALPTVFNNADTLSASGTAITSQVGTVNVTVENPAPGAVTSASKAVAVTNGSQVATAAAAVRFLEQSTFGPTQTLINQVEQTGFTPFLDDQFSLNVSTFPDPSAANVAVNNQVPTQQELFTNALTNPDQLRQRVALALSEIWVASGLTVPAPGLPPYLRLLTQDAFVNYRQIMYDITLSPAMGNYLNMANNDKPNATANTEANQNYARELMQLFTLGVYKLNQDGSMQTDSSGNTIPTYTQGDVVALSNAFTGWTYPTMPGATLQKHNPAYWLGPMEALDSNHDTAVKTFLGTTLPAGQTAAQDLGGTATFSSGALDIIFNHPNLPPFVCKQLIQHLVSSNPSAAYVKRIADVFVSGSFGGFGSGTRGDMQAVIAAILLDPEARRGDLPSTTVATDGHLREPILYIANLLRAFGATSDGAAPVTYANNLGQPPLRENSVFSFFPPDYVIPATTPALLGPEFDLQTTAQALARINFVNSFAFGSIGSGTTVSFTAYATLASTPGTLIDSLNALLLHGTLSATSRASILTAVNAVAAGSNQNLLRAETAIYLIASASQYQIEQ